MKEHAGQAHTDFAEAKLQRRLIEGSLEDSEINALSVVALAGAAAESMQYEEVCSVYVMLPTASSDPVSCIPQVFILKFCMTVFVHCTC